MILVKDEKYDITKNQTEIIKNIEDKSNKILKSLLLKSIENEKKKKAENEQENINFKKQKKTLKKEIRCGIVKKKNLNDEIRAYKKVEKKEK